MNDEPVVVKEWRKRWLFGLVRIDYHVEDRRPDLTREECNQIDLGKFKHFLDVRVFWWHCNWTFRTSHNCEDLPYVYCCGKSQIRP